MIILVIFSKSCCALCDYIFVLIFVFLLNRVFFIHRYPLYGLSQLFKLFYVKYVPQKVE